MQTFALQYWRDEGWYLGRLAEAPCVMSQGQSLAELEENIPDAYQLMVESEPAPTDSPVETRLIEV
jgi:predicted RNase H-like HicB family nuclease